MIDYLKKIIRSQSRLYLLLLAIFILLAAFEFVLLAIYSCFETNDALGQNGILRMLPFIAIFISFFLTLLINNYFIENKNEEFSIILLSGCRLKEILFYIIIQFGLLIVIADTIGFFVGYAMMYQLNQTLDYVFYYHMNTIYIVFFALLVCKLLYIFVLNFGKFIRIKLDIADYLSCHSSKTSKPNYFSAKFLNHKDDKRHHFPVSKFLITIIGCLFIVSGIQEILTDQETMNLPIYFAFALCGEVILINTTIPLIFDLLHDRILLKSPKLLMILSNTIDLSNVLVSMINILACVIPICLSNFFFERTTLEMKTVTMICFYILLIIILLSFMIRFTIYIPKTSTNIATSKALGFHLKDLHFINMMVVVMIMIMIVIFPVILYGILLKRAFLLSYISYSLMIQLIASYLIIFLILGVYMIVHYYVMTKEAYRDVKYLNRSE